MALAAIAIDGELLEFASDELRADKEVILAAMVHDGDMLEFASGELQADLEVALAALNSNSN